MSSSLWKTHLNLQEVSWQGKNIFHLVLLIPSHSVFKLIFLHTSQSQGYTSKPLLTTHQPFTNLSLWNGLQLYTSIGCLVEEHLHKINRIYWWSLGIKGMKILCKHQAFLCKHQTPQALKVKKKNQIQKIAYLSMHKMTSKAFLIYMVMWKDRSSWQGCKHFFWIRAFNSGNACSLFFFF